jgi:ATP-binding cassette subfamily B protein
MDRGQVVDEGTHEELLTRGGIYADLYRLQFQDGRAVVDVSATRMLSSEADVNASARRGLLARIADIWR